MRAKATGVAQRENDRREERGIWAGHSKRIVGPTCQRFCSTSGSYVVSCTDARPSPSTHFLPSAASSPSHLPAGHGEKFRRTRAHVQLGTRLRRMAGPKGKRSKEPVYSPKIIQRFCPQCRRG